MSLILPPWQFANEVDNATGTPTSLWGTVVTPGTGNADGTAATLLTALAFDVHYLMVGFSGYNVASAAHYALADILIDPSGGTAWRSFIDDLLVGFSGDGQQRSWFFFPIFIKAGTSIGSQVRTSHSVASTNPRCAIYAFGNPSRPEMWWCGGSVQTLGVTAASSIGTSVTPGNSGAMGNWANIGGTTVGRYGAIQFGSNGTDANAALLFYHFQIGYNNVVLPGSPELYVGIDTAERSWANPTGPIWCDIPQGTQLQVRGTCSGTAEIFAGGIALYGVY